MFITCTVASVFRYFMLSFFVWLLPLWNTLAQEGSFHPNEVGLDSARGPQHPVELEIFFDGLFPALLEAYHVPGAVVVMVKDDSLFFAKGYGYADLENQTLIDPATTLFRIGSVSKLMTATAVMQQVEQNQLVLDTDVNDYLSGFKIREAFDKPVTLFNLLTHTPGFDDTYSGFTELLTTAPTPLSEYLALRQPARVIPPGEVISYLQATFLISLFVLLSNADQYELMRHLPANLTALLVLPLLLPYFLLRGFTRDVQAPLVKLHYWSLVVLAFLALGIEWY